MAQRKPSFRFRIPSWLSGTPESMHRRSKDSSKSTGQSNTNVPIQRPSRPSLITPAEFPTGPKTQEKTITEPQNQSPTQPTPLSTSVIVETTHSKPSSPPTSIQPSSSHAASQVHVVSSEHQTPQEAEAEAELKVNSPLREITKSPETSLQPERMPLQPIGFEKQASPMPSSPKVSKIETASQHHPLSPLAPERKNEVLKANHEDNTFYKSSTSQKRKEKIPVSVFEPVPNESERKMNSPSKIIPVSQPENLSKQTKTNLDEERSISTTTPPKSPLETQRKFLQHKEKEKVIHDTKKVGKVKEKSTSQPNRHTKASSSGTKDKKQHGVRETVERKIMFATSNSSGKGIGVMSSKDPSSSISNQRTVPSSDEREKEKEKEKEKAPMQKGIKNDITKFVHKISASVQPTQPMDDKKFSVITLTGDNRGATMHVGSELDKKEGSIHIHRAYKPESEESIEVTTDGEGNTNNEEEDSMEHSEVGKAYVNSNIQSINNSLMFHGSINERDPGVQVTLPQKPLETINREEKDTHNGSPLWLQ